MSSRTLTAAFAACLFLLIVTAKWATYDRYGSAMPDWDQWDAEAVHLLTPWLTHDHFLEHFFEPHNEHRVLLTKLQNLTLSLLNGQWDARLEAVTNAMLHALIAVGLWVAGRRWLAGRWQVPLFLLLLALFAPPVAWQNVLGGFHSQQYWLVALSFVAILLLPFRPTWSASWWIGVLAAILVMGSMGSGLLAAAAVLVVVVWRWARHEINLRAAGPAIALALALVALGLLTRVEVPYHQEMKAQNVHDFVFTIIHSMEWPWRDQEWAAALFWLPWALVAWRVLAAKPEPPDGATPDPLRRHAGPALVALGGWVLLQLAATGYARGAGADYPASRYMDTLTFGTAINGLALGWLFTHPAARRAGRIGHHLLGLTWVLTLALGLQDQLKGTFDIELPDAKKYYVKAEGHMLHYLSTNDPAALAYPDIPYPGAGSLIERLEPPRLRAMMPSPIRPPLALAPQATSGSPFLATDLRQAAPDAVVPLGLSPATPPLDYTRFWGSYRPDGPGAAAQGEWKSQPLTLARTDGWLRFETAGQLGEPGVALELRDAATDALLATIRPSKVPGDNWRTATVRAPRVPFVVVARDHDPARWLAFTGPVEMGPLSYWAWQATKQALLLLYLSAAATVLLALAAWRGRPRPGQPG